jgi:hypothetical protein
MSTEKSDLISLREAARRLGVSDTAVRKAIETGRIRIAGRTESSGRPLVAWEGLQTAWFANSDEGKRTHGGVNAPQVRKPADLSPGTPQDDAQSFARARAMKEEYQALLAQLEYEEKSKLLVKAAEVEILWCKQIVSAKTIILGIQAKCKTRVGDLPLAVIATIEAVCREALESLANEQHDETD